MPCRHLYDAHEGHGGDDTDAASRMTPFTYREVTLHERLRESARDVGTKAAVIHGERTTTFADLDAASDRLAGALARRGVGRGDRVTLFMPNSVEFVIGFYATLKAGGVVNPINAQSKEREVRFQVGDSGAKAVLVHEALWPVVDPIKTLDASVSYKISEQLTLTLDGSNLLDQAYHDYHGTPLLPRDVRRYDRVVGLALRRKM